MNINFSDSQRGTLELLAAMILMGTVGYFVIEADQPPHNVVFFRCAFGALFLILYCLVAGLFKDTGLTRKKILLIIISGIFLVCNWIMLFASFKTASISTSTIIYHTQPFFFVLIGAVVLREVIKLHKIFWMITAFFGVFLVADVEIESFSPSSSYFIGIVLALSAALFWAVSAMMVKQIKGIKPHLITLVQLTIGVVILFPFIDVVETSSITNLQWRHLVTLGGLHTCIVYILMYSSYPRLSTPVVAVLTFIYPAVAILVDFIFYNVSLSASQFIGVLLIMLASICVNRNPLSLFQRRA